MEMELASFSDDDFNMDDLAGIDEEDLGSLYESTLKKTRFVLNKIEEPRKLTEEEIDDIVNSIPTVVSPDQDISDLVMESIRRVIKNLLSLPGMEIVPSAIPALREELVNKYRQTRMQPGSMVGLYAAQAISAQLMQATLNTFHKSGSSKNVALGFKAYDQFMKLSEHISFPSNKIFFNDNPSYEVILRDKKPVIVSMTVKDIMVDYNIIKYNDEEISQGNGWYKTFYWMNKNKFNDWKEIKDMYKEFQESGYFLRIKLNVHKMYEHKITVSDVSEIMDKYGDNEVISVGSPFMTDKGGKLSAFMDVYPIKEKVKFAIEGNKKKGISFDLNDKYTEISQIYINTTILPQLDNFKIKGIDKIKNLYPEEYSIWDIVFLETRNRQNANQYILTLDRNKMISKGITKLHILKLWNEVLEILDHKAKDAMSKIEQVKEDNYLILVLPKKPSDAELKKTIDNTSAQLKWNPTSIINYITNKEIDKQVDYKKQQISRRNKYLAEGKLEETMNMQMLLPRSDFQNALYYIYAETDGSNLEGLFELPDVDPDRTTSNVPREMIGVFGVEATRNFLASELHSIIVLNENYINPRHTMLIADHMTKPGYLIPINLTGMTHQPIGTLSRAGFRKATDQLKPAFLTGRTENVTSINTSIMVGKKMRTGTGLPSFRVNKDRQKELLDSLKTKEMSRQTFESQFDEANRIDEEDTFAADITENIFVSEDQEGRVSASGNLGVMSQPMRYTSSQVGDTLVGTRIIIGTNQLPPNTTLANSKYIDKFPNIVYLNPPLPISYIDSILA